MKAVIKEDNGSKWLCCGRCGHKLAKVMSDGTGLVASTESVTSRFGALEIKCSSCKELNLLK